MSTSLRIAKSLPELNDISLLTDKANRHGLITGATGTGKTVTLQKMAEMFSSVGVPVFVADVKGDLSGIACEAAPSEKLSARLEKIGVTDWQPSKSPVEMWDVFGEKGQPIRATISDVGPLLLSRLLDLNSIQSGLMQMIFKIADDNGMLLLDLKDLQAMTTFVAENAAEFKTTYGNVSKATAGAIQRGLLTLEQEGADIFFGEPMLDVRDLIRTDSSGKGVINIIAADKLYNMPKLYATTLLWLLSELFEQLPEVGDREKPRLVFFFDEAHLLFTDAPAVFVEKVEQVVRLIRSKGVGVYFVTQNPADVPERVLGQLGNRVQHALRAFTPKDQKGVRAAAQTMRANPNFDTEKAIMELGTGEALISFLDEKGSPSVVEIASVIAPGSRMGPITDEERRQLINNSFMIGKYDRVIDRESAYELLKAHAQEKAAVSEARVDEKDSGIAGKLKDFIFGSTGPRGGKKDGVVQKTVNSASRQISNKIARSILDTILKKK